MVPPSKAPYRLNQKELKLKKKLNNLLDRGYIWQNKSPYGAPILFVDKKIGKLRMCIYYHAFNKITIKNNYFLPHINDLLHQLNKAEYFSWIDLKSKYYQIHIIDEDVENIVMRTKYGLYEFQMMPFGLCNAPLMFTTLMNSIFHEKLDKFMIIYIDDIFVYSR